MTSRLSFILVLIGSMAVAVAPAEEHSEDDGPEAVNINAQLLFFDIFELQFEPENHVRAQALSVPLLSGRAQVVEDGEVDVQEGEVPLFRLAQVEQIEQGHVHCDFLELPFSALYRGDWRGEDTRWDLLDLPLVTALTHGRGENSWMWGFIEGPIVTAFHADRSEESADVRLLDIPFISAFEYDRNANGNRWEILDMPLITVIEGGRTEEGASFNLLDLPIFRSLFKIEPHEGEALFLFEWSR